MTALRFISAALSLLLVAGCPSRDSIGDDLASKGDASASLPPAAELCSVVANPNVYDGKEISVRGCVTTDGNEYVVLSDLEKPCPDGGIVPIDSAQLREEDRFTPEVGVKVCGVFSGTFRSSTNIYDRVLEVKATSDLHSAPLR